MENKKDSSDCVVCEGNEEKEPPGSNTYISHEEDFYIRFFPDSEVSDWNNWKWQLKHRITTFDQINKILALSEDEKKALLSSDKNLPFAITPYYASLLEKDNSGALRRTVIPVADEFVKSHDECEDPLGEDHQSPVQGLVHRYPDRVLFLVTSFCSVNCRYCCRSRVVGNSLEISLKEQWTKCIEYIKAHEEIRDVLISGGDPLTLSDENMDWLLGKIRNIPHVEIIRIGSKVPAVLPQRITASLVKILKKHHPLFMSLHFTHPIELTKETTSACNRLADAGIPLGSQTVLLKGINDSVGVMGQLFKGLLKIRVKPYYLYQCDQIMGSSHFRTKISKGQEIIMGLRGHISGYAIPHFVIDLPNGGGKTPILPDYYQGREGDVVTFKNYLEKKVQYSD